MKSIYEFKTLEKSCDSCHNIYLKFWRIIENDVLLINSYLKNSKELLEARDALYLLFRCSDTYVTITRLLKNKSYYQSRILFRSLLEHYLKAQYIILNFDEKINLSINYHLYGQIEEFITSVKNKNIHNYLTEEEKINLWDEIYKHFPNVRHLQKNEIESAINQFNVKNIIKHVSSRFKEHSEIYDHFEMVLKYYGECSMFVHGSPSAGDYYQTKDSFDEEEFSGLFNMITMPIFMIFDTLKIVIFHSKIRFRLSISSFERISEELVNLQLKLNDRTSFLEEINSEKINAV
ncbi:DUF5677 domain-containing protein [Leptospira perdikensis]|uniref:DUF5677 domain-containing protein n=1 Tax=Leptospira perdikensis TaxID=2484948 RepID=UPI001ABFB5EF|nr:DUF5677 domain-containing protein [Leptospira perdikensis]